MSIFIGYLIPEAISEQLIFSGNNNNSFILLAVEKDTNYLFFERDDIRIMVTDSTIRVYNSGGISIKNPDAGIFVWGHPDGNKYNLTILTSAGFDKITVTSIFSEPEKVIVGADISRYDIPTEGRSQPTPYVKPEKVHDLDSLDILTSVPHKVQYRHNFYFDFTAIDTQIKSKNDQRLSGVSVFTTIFNPIEEIMGTWNGTTISNGWWGNEYYIIENQMLGEYNLKVTMEKENYTPITKMISFFVIPLTDDGGSARKCPFGYFYNNTQQCEEDLK